MSAPLVYQRWAEKRGMRSRVVSETEANDNGPCRIVLAMEGFAAYTILSREQGLHLLEEGASSERSTPQKATVRVRVAPQPDEPPSYQNLTLAEQADVSLRENADEELKVVRRYQQRPTPLVRDRAGGWRTGRLDLVLDGNFDIISKESSKSETQ